MLKVLPIIGSVALTIIIVAGLVIILLRSSRKISDALSRNMPNVPAGTRSTCCHAFMRPYGWTADGWVATCRACGNWQYLGDDHENPPLGFNTDGSGDFRRNARCAGPNEIDYLMPGTLPADAVMPELRQRHIGKHPALGAPYGNASGGVILCTCNVRYQLAGEHREGCPLRPYRVGEQPTEQFTEVTSDPLLQDDEGEPLTLPPMPNVGGEGNPVYEGPHYAPDELAPEQRFIPYDMLRNPIPGTGVFEVKDDDELAGMPGMKPQTFDEFSRDCDRLDGKESK